MNNALHILCVLYMFFTLMTIWNGCSMWLVTMWYMIATPVTCNIGYIILIYHYSSHTVKMAKTCANIDCHEHKNYR